MRLNTILFMPSFSLKERASLLGDWSARKAATLIPQRIAYWSFILQASAVFKGDEVVPEVTVMTVLDRLPGGPK